MIVENWNNKEVKDEQYNDITDRVREAVKELKAALLAQPTNWGSSGSYKTTNKKTGRVIEITWSIRQE